MATIANAPARPPAMTKADRGAAVYLGAPLSTVRLWREQGLLPHVMIGGKLYYRYDDLDAFISEHRVSAAA